MKKLAITMTALLACGAAQAHYLWLEPGDAGARLYFGEAEALLKEQSPGKLDNIKGPRAYAVDTAGKQVAAPIARATDHIAVTGKAAGHAVAEESLEVRDLQKHGLGIAKTNYYARSGQPASGVSVLPLDMQSQEAGSFTVLYRGQPLKGAKLEVIAPNTWIQEHTTDARGMVRINAPWRGQYVLHVLHVDKTPGEFGSAKYDNVRSHFTYTFVRNEGADPGPAVPPTHPME